jgi:tetratricopeptide (TPR) repeat protein
LAREKAEAERRAAEQAEAERKAQEHVSLGVALYDKGDWDGAIGKYREALFLKPDNAEAHDNLGDALQGKRDWEGAINEYRKALLLKPDLYPEARIAVNSVLKPLDRKDDIVIGLIVILGILVSGVGTFLWLSHGLRIRWWFSLPLSCLAYVLWLVFWLCFQQLVLLPRWSVLQFGKRFPDGCAERPIALSILAEMKAEPGEAAGVLQDHFKLRP